MNEIKTIIFQLSDCFGHVRRTSWEPRPTSLSISLSLSLSLCVCEFVKMFRSCRGTRCSLTLGCSSPPLARRLWVMARCVNDSDRMLCVFSCCEHCHTPHNHVSRAPPTRSTCTPWEEALWPTTTNAHFPTTASILGTPGRASVF